MTEENAVATFAALDRAILPPEQFELSTEGVGLAPKGRAARGTEIVAPKLEQLNEMQSLGLLEMRVAQAPKPGGWRR
jgi:hypothetical protein